jgi:hypothetical protein
MNSIGFARSVHFGPRNRSRLIRRPGAHRRTFLERIEQGPRLKSEPGILRGVTVLGLTSRNGRYYTPESAENALPLYENCAVFVDHPDDPLGKRSVRDRFGRLRNLRMEGRKVRADLHYNTAHPFAPTLEWFAENDPGAVGLSHNVEAEGEENYDGTFVVRQIVTVRSVDLVAEPATTTSLFEAYPASWMYPTNVIDEEDVEEDALPLFRPDDELLYPEHSEDIVHVPCHHIRGLLEDPDLKGRGEDALRAAIQDVLDRYEFGDDGEDEMEEGVLSTVGGLAAGPIGGAIGKAIDDTNAARHADESYHYRRRYVRRALRITDREFAHFIMEGMVY